MNKEERRGREGGKGGRGYKWSCVRVSVVNDAVEGVAGDGTERFVEVECRYMLFAFWAPILFRRVVRGRSCAGHERRKGRTVSSASWPRALQQGPSTAYNRWSGCHGM
jgi:hypothetical protein